MKKILISLFIAFPLIISLFIIATPDISFSENENRNLTVKSSIDKSIFKGEFQTDFEAYLSDQFPFRDKLKALDSEAQFLLGKREIGGAYICKNKRLVQKVESVDEQALIRYADKINAVAEKTGVKTYVMYVPSAVAVSKDVLPAGAPSYDYAALKSTLAAHLENAQIINLDLTSDDYFLTDHHWNYSGVYSAYLSWCEAHGSAPREFEKRTFSTDFRGTNYSKVLINSLPYDELSAPVISDKIKVNADGADIPFYDLKALETKDKYNVFEGGNHGVVIIENPENKNGKTLVIFKDSFANSFVPFIAYDYEKIVMIDERYTFEDASSLAEGFKATEIAVIREIIN